MGETPMPRKMNSQSQTSLQWIDSQQGSLIEKVMSWSNINSYSFDIPGLARMAEVLADELKDFGPVERIDLPPAESINSQAQVEHHPLGQALRVTHNLSAP